MEILVNVKRIGKRKNSITKIPYKLEGTPETVKELITEVVKVCVIEYNQKLENKEILTILSHQEIEEKAEVGKIGFGILYGENQAALEEALENAVQSFEDGLFRIFIGEEEVKTLNQNIQLEEQSELTFVRMTMLSGRIW